MLRIKRVYMPPSAEDGARILVDRLWPRGLTRASARIDDWLRDLGPSDRLRRWFHADESRWTDFRRLYRRELAARDETLAPLKTKAAQGTVTLLYAARDPEHNNAIVLKEVLTERRRRRVDSRAGRKRAAPGSQARHRRQ